MKNSKKIIISLGVVAVAIIIALSITLGALAAKIATINTAITVGYTSTEVSAKVSATYKEASASTAIVMKNGDDESITFDGNESTATGSLTCPNIDLTSDNKSVVFVYTFENTGDSAFYVNGTIPSTQTNVTITAISDSDTSDSTDAVTNTISSNSLTQIEVAGHKTATITITVAITEIRNNASFSGNFQWTLTNVYSKTTSD
jgi:hypothetical protein